MPWLDQLDTGGNLPGTSRTPRATPASLSGGTAPVTGFHSTIERPEPVRRVAPPTTTISEDQEGDDLEPDADGGDAPLARRCPLRHRCLRSCRLRRVLLSARTDIPCNAGRQRAPASQANKAGPRDEDAHAQADRFHHDDRLRHRLRPHGDGSGAGRITEAAGWVQGLTYAVLGLAWVLPAALIIRWMEKPEKTR